MEVDVGEHEHPLKLVDWQIEYPQYEEEEEGDEGGDPITKEGFRGVCNRCGQEIHMYHRYYYKCIRSCHNVSLHKFCAELPSKLKHSLHPHPLSVLPNNFNYECSICKIYHGPGEVVWHCFKCIFFIDVTCAVEVGKNVIYHPSHPHPLMRAIPKPILCECNACGKEHKGMFYQCISCVGFTIHSECAFLPKTLLIQQRTDGAFYHTHPLTISYSFPWMDQWEKHFPPCRVCSHDFSMTENLWIYKCDDCLYYAHVDCATSRREPFMSIFLPPGKNIKNFEDADHPRLLHLPFPDETYSVPKHLFFQGTITSDYKVNLRHISHEHPLILVDVEKTSSSINNSSLLLMCHDPMKKTQLLCNGCLRPITSTMPFYKCVEHCNFVLHEWCTRLPTEIETHQGHPQHTLRLMYSNGIPFFFGVFHCDVCRLPCNGFAYCCVECGYHVDVTCGLIPQKITHETHPNHLLSLFRMLKDGKRCQMCLQYLNVDQLLFRCNTCDIYVHLECALLLPKEIRHKYDKHPMHLSYLPIENHKSEYFCEICEDDLDPHQSFYHCQDCVQSVHSACAPSILQSELVTYTLDRKSIYYFLNIKFGGIFKKIHIHPLTFAQGIVLDGDCIMCDHSLHGGMIFKCLRCKFAIHYNCCKRLSSSEFLVLPPKWLKAQLH